MFFVGGQDSPYLGEKEGNQRIVSLIAIIGFVAIGKLGQVFFNLSFPVLFAILLPEKIASLIYLQRGTESADHVFIVVGNCVSCGNECLQGIQVFSSTTPRLLGYVLVAVISGQCSGAEKFFKCPAVVRSVGLMPHSASGSSWSVRPSQ